MRPLALSRVNETFSASETSLKALTQGWSWGVPLVPVPCSLRWGALCGDKVMATVTWPNRQEQRTQVPLLPRAVSRASPLHSSCLWQVLNAGLAKTDFSSEISFYKVERHHSLHQIACGVLCIAKWVQAKWFCPFQFCYLFTSVVTLGTQEAITVLSRWGVSECPHNTLHRYLST